MVLAEPLDVIKQVADIFASQGIRYLVSGSIASSFYGIPRATRDADIVAEIGSRQVVPLVKALKAEFYVDADLVADAVLHKSSFNIFYMATMFKVDVFVLKETQVFQLEMDRRKEYQIPEQKHISLYMATAEDIIIQKLLWYRLGGEVSDNQWSDVLGVLKVQKEMLDYKYLKQVAQDQDLLPLLRRAVAESRTKNK